MIALWHDARANMTRHVRGLHEHHYRSVTRFSFFCSCDERHISFKGPDSGALASFPNSGFSLNAYHSQEPYGRALLHGLGCE